MEAGRSDYWTQRHLLGLPGNAGFSPLETSYAEAALNVTKARANYLMLKAARQQEADANSWGMPFAPFRGKYFTNLQPVPALETLHRDDAFYAYHQIPGRDSTPRRYHKVFVYELSSVLVQSTVWLAPHYDINSNRRTFLSATGIVPESLTWPDDVVEVASVAQWPSEAELKYEGIERVTTDPNHRRFLPVPRVPGEDTVAWQHRPYTSQYPLDEVYAGSPRMRPSAEHVAFHNHEVSLVVPILREDYPNGEYPPRGSFEYERTARRVNPFGDTDEEIVHHLLGADLLMRLDPQGIYDQYKDY